jgi:hypothetical protein
MKTIKVHFEFEIAGDGTPGWEGRAMETLDGILNGGLMQDGINENEPNDPSECANCSGYGQIKEETITDGEWDGPVECPYCLGHGETGHLHVTEAVVRRVA